MIQLLVYLIYTGLAAIAGRWIFVRKGRNPLTGTVLGAVTSLFTPLVLLAFLVIAFIMPPLKKEDKSATMSAEERADALVEKLKELEGLRDREVITNEQFEKSRDQILAASG